MELSLVQCYQSLGEIKVMTSSAVKRLVILFHLPLQIRSAPLDRRIQSIGSIDPSTDEWSSTLSGIGPLILLVGERTTKQVLRNVRSIASAFSLAAAPLGLLSVVTSLIRICGTQSLRAYIGYELEARTVAGIEITRVNCGGVHAHLTDGYVVRSMAANPASQLVAVSILEGENKEIADEATRRIMACSSFEGEKRKRGLPDNVANSRWVMHIVTPTKARREVVVSMIETLATAIGYPHENLDDFPEHVAASCDIGSSQRGDVLETSIHEDEGIRNVESIIEIPAAKQDSDPTEESAIQVSVLELSSTLPTLSEKGNIEPTFWKFTFMNTFDAVSEFTTSKQVSDLSAMLIGSVSLTAILAIYLLDLWQNGWVMSIGWILVVVGYAGIVSGVTVAAVLIHSSCQCIKLEFSGPSSGDGMVVSVKNTDSMDTTGSKLVSCMSKRQRLEAVWIKPSSSYERLLATITTISLVVAFITHYLGLRAIRWWASVGELGVCLIASFARSTSNERQEPFRVVEDVKVDKRCISTGIIRTQTARLIDQKSNKGDKHLDARAFSLVSFNYPPNTGERIAFQAAKLCMSEPILKGNLLRLTGMMMKLWDNEDENCSIIASFNGSLLLSEGLGSPTAHLCIAFQAKRSDLASPTAFLARAIMRQPEWMLGLPGFGNGIPVGNVYFPSIQSIMDWWTLSEDRNDLCDLQKNLHWPFVLINTTFFIQLFDQWKEGGKLATEVSRAQGRSDENEKGIAQEVVGFLQRLFK